ncbi:hypothetical protein E8E11_008195 [Didymella keratinophila]|nr:hypothetical protein E8E11_008195 [Didymella keratinophila]
MSQPSQIAYVNLTERRNISHVLTPRVDYFFRTTAILTVTGGTQNDGLAEDLRSMVLELKQHGITTWFVMSCFPKTKVYDARAEWAWVTWIEGEFRDVASALHELLAEEQGPAGRVHREPSAKDYRRATDMLSQPWSVRPPTVQFISL